MSTVIVEMRTKLYAVSNVMGLLFGLIGGILLFYSLTPRASNYKLVEKNDHDVAICLNDKVVATGYGGPLRVTDETCPEGIMPSVAAVIEADHPAFVSWGMGLIIVGFLLQLPAALIALSAQN
jgi:hypothetical protein